MCEDTRKLRVLKLKIKRHIMDIYSRNMHDLVRKWYHISK